MLNVWDDHIIAQNWQAYAPAEHQMWRRLAARQRRLLPGRVSLEILANLDALSILGSGIPHFERINEILFKATGWRIVAVPGLLPDDLFFGHLAARRFPVARTIRSPKQMDCLSEPDAFHDLFGHVPLLMNPLFAEYLQALGEGAPTALGLGAMARLSRLYRYTVEFGLIETRTGLRAYGAGLASSAGALSYCLDAAPHHIRFDLERVMRTRYHTGDFQPGYFVISDFRELGKLARRDFAPIYQALDGVSDIEPGALVPGDTVLQRGTGELLGAR
jgi:phenylalanine-4-hydroxylase